MFDEFDNVDIHSFKVPCTILVSGPTGSGKTHTIAKIIKNRKSLFSCMPDRVIYCFRVWQPKYDEILNSDAASHEIAFCEGLYDFNKLTPDKGMTLLIVDDLMNSLCKELSEVFTIKSHHCNVCLIFVNQNLFQQSPWGRTCFLNCHYLLIFKIKRDRTPLSVLGKQLYPENPAAVLEVYNSCTEDPFSYMLVDIHPQSEHRFLLRDNIFEDEIQTVYLPSEQK